MTRKPDRELVDKLEQSLEAITAQNTGRPIRCLCGCGLTFVGPGSAARYFTHNVTGRQS